MLPVRDIGTCGDCFFSEELGDRDLLDYVRCRLNPPVLQPRYKYSNGEEANAHFEPNRWALPVVSVDSLCQHYQPQSKPKVMAIAAERVTDSPERDKERMLELIRKNNPLTVSELTRKTQWLTGDVERKAMLQDLVSAGLVVAARGAANAKGGFAPTILNATPT